MSLAFARDLAPVVPTDQLQRRFPYYGVEVWVSDGIDDWEAVWQVLDHYIGEPNTDLDCWDRVCCLDDRDKNIPNGIVYPIGTKAHDWCIRGWCEESGNYCPHEDDPIVQYLDRSMTDLIYIMESKTDDPYTDRSYGELDDRLKVMLNNNGGITPVLINMEEWLDDDQSGDHWSPYNTYRMIRKFNTDAINAGWEHTNPRYI